MSHPVFKPEFAEILGTPVNEIIVPPEFAEDLHIHEDGRSQVEAPALHIDDGFDDGPLREQHQAEVSQAFGVKPFFWKDLELFPFAIDREGDWMRHRELLGEAPLREVMGLPFAMLPDALRVLWFCAVDPKEWLMVPSMVEEETGWRRLSGQERAMTVEMKIREWAKDHVSREDGVLAVNTFYDLYNSSQATRAIAKPGEHHREDKAKN